MNNDIGLPLNTMTNCLFFDIAGIVRPQTMQKPNLPKQMITTTVAPKTEAAVSVAPLSTTGMY